MKIENIQNKIVVTGNIVTQHDREALSRAVESLDIEAASELTIEFHDTASLNSSVVGYLVKIKTINKVDLNVVVTDEKLYRLLSTMGLSGVLNLRGTSG